MDKAVKNTISHRSRSLAQLKNYLIDHADTIVANKKAKTS